MLFNFEESQNERKIPDALKIYFFQHCDMTESEFEDLIKIAEDIPFDALKSRLKIIADFFYRFKKDKNTQKIHNEFAYAKKIINSDSFFENQKTDLSIPGVEETEKYLQEIIERRKNNPGVDKETFHQKVEYLKEMYDSQFEDTESDHSKQTKETQSKKKMATVLKKLEDEEKIKKLEMEILPFYKDLISCELEYRLFKTALINMYLYHGEDAFHNLLSLIKEKQTLSIKELSELREVVLKRKENFDGI